MPRITFIATDGETIEADAMESMTLMEVALLNDVPGIIGMCGGICSCATCHVHLADEWIARLPAPSAEEREMVEALADGDRSSRLGCQVFVTADMDGLTVRVAEPE